MAGLGSDSFSSNTNPNNNPGGGVGGGSGSSGNAGGPVVPFSNNNSGTAGYANNSGRMQGIGSGPWDPNAKKETFGTCSFVHSILCCASRSIGVAKSVASLHASTVVSHLLVPSQQRMCGQLRSLVD